MRLRGALIGLGLLASLGLTGSATAGLDGTIVPNPVFFSNNDALLIEGFVELVDTEVGAPAGTTVLAGAPSATDIFLVFNITITAGEIDTVGIGATDISDGGLAPTGAGSVTGFGANTDVAGVIDAFGTEIFIFDGPAAGGNNNVTLGPGETATVFVSYASLDFDGTEFISFMIVDTGPDVFFTVPLVPGPGSLALLGLGAAALTGRSPRRRRA